MIKINRTNIAEHLLEYQFSLINKTIEDALANKAWLVEWTLTPEQQEHFKSYAIALIKKVFKCNKKKSESIFSWFILNFGLGTF